MKRALITGITGQDGSFLSEWLLQHGYRVFGLVRPGSSSYLDQMNSQIEVLEGDMAKGEDITSAIIHAAPDEIYNLASQSRPGLSWAKGTETLEVNALGAIRLFEAVRQSAPKSRIYHASSSEMFGETLSQSQDESTPFNPCNPYAAAKVYAHHMARIYREGYNLYISCGILFNHESERRPRHFLTQKVAYGAACASLGIAESDALNEIGHPIVNGGKLFLGNLSIARDWGHAADFVRAMWLMLQQDDADDFVIGTGQLHTLQQLCESAYSEVGLEWRDHVVSDPALVRPLEAGQSLADPAKARAKLGWAPTIGFEEMIARMVRHQLDLLRSS